MATARILETDHAVLQRLARESGKNQQQIIHEALDTYQRERLLDEINAGFERLRSDSAAWQAEMDERKLWETTLTDDIDA